MKHALVPLGQVADFVRGVTYKPEDLMENFADGSVVCMRTANIQVQLDESDLRSIPVGLVKSNYKLLREGDILVSTANSWNLVGKCCWVPKLTYAAAPGGFIAALRADPAKIEPRYLYHWFNSPKTQANARNCGRQTTNISNMDLSRCLALQTPLPELAEQRRIAAILDKADALGAKRRDVIAKLEQLQSSLFFDTFGDPVLNSMGWPTSAIGDECEVGTGSTPSRSNGMNFNGDIPWVKSTEVNWGRIVRTGEFVSESGKRGARLKVYPPETVVVALYGQGVTRGKCATLGVHATMNQACAGISPSKSVSTSYLFHFLKNSYSRLRDEGRGGNQENLNLAILKSFEIPVPPTSLQVKFHSLVSSLDEMSKKHETAKRISSSLFSSLQQRAFSGGL